MFRIIISFLIFFFIVVDVQPCLPQSSREKAISLFNSKKYDSAYSELKKLIKSNTVDDELYFYYGASNFRKKEPNFRTALSYLIHATSGDKIHDEWLFELAVLCDSIENKNLKIEKINVFNLAVLNYKKVIKLDNELVDDSYFSLGKLYHRKQKLDSAIVKYEALFHRNSRLQEKVKPKLTAALLSLANQHQNQSNLKETKNLFKKIIKIQPTHLESRLRLGDIYSGEDSLENAQEHYEYIRNHIDPNNLDAITKLKEINTKNNPKGDNGPPKKKIEVSKNNKEADGETINPPYPKPSPADTSQTDIKVGINMANNNILFIRISLIIFPIILWVFAYCFIKFKKLNVGISDNIIKMLSFITLTYFIVFIYFDKNLKFSIEGLQIIITIILIVIFFEFLLIQKRMLVTFNIFTNFFRLKIPLDILKNIKFIQNPFEFTKINFINFSKIILKNIEYDDGTKINKLSIISKKDKNAKLTLGSDNDSVFTLNSMEFTENMEEKSNGQAKLDYDECELYMEKSKQSMTFCLNMNPKLNLKPNQFFVEPLDCYIEKEEDDILIKELKTKKIRYNETSTIEIDNGDNILKIEIYHPEFPRKEIKNLTCLDKLKDLFLFTCFRKCKEQENSKEFNCNDCPNPKISQIKKGLISFRHYKRVLRMHEILKTWPNKFEKMSINYTNNSINLRFIGKLKSLKVGVPEYLSEQPEEIPNFAHHISSGRSSFIIIAILAWMSFLGALQESKFIDSIKKFIGILN